MEHPLTQATTDDLRRALDTAHYYEEHVATVQHGDGTATHCKLADVEAELAARSRCD